ncbi:MAG: lysophospholipase [Chitinophagaceae bacterium]
MYPSSNLITGTFKNNEGQNLFYRNWKIAADPKAVVLIVHGFNSHSGYYQDFALHLNENQFEVYAIDLRGRGHSEGERYFIKDYRNVIDDINKLSNIVKMIYPELPLFIFGHSAGGVFASVYAARYQQKLQGLISESFAFEIPAPGFALTLIKLLAHIIPRMRLIKLNNKDFSRDEIVVNTLNNDPLVAEEKQPVKTMQQLLLASVFLRKVIPEIKLPLLVLHGTGDKATLPAGSIYFMKNAGSVDKQLELYDGYFHDLLNDKDNGIVVGDIVSWLNERI